MRDVERRIRELEQRDRAAYRRLIFPVPLYTVWRDGEPRPNVEGPVYQLVSPR